MKFKSSILRDIFDLTSSSIVSLLGSIVTGLVVPAALGATDYGYYRIFVLYSTYASLLHCGFVDGIILKNSGKEYKNLNKFKFRSTSISFIIMQLLVATGFFILSIFIKNYVYSIICICVGVNAFLSNITTYYRYVSQAVLRFKELSIRNTIQALLIILLTLLMYVLYKCNILTQINFLTYILIMLFIYTIMFTYYLISYRDITFGKHDKLYFGFKRLVRYCIIGIFMTISYQVSNLMLIIDNQFVSNFFKVSTYGKYSFSYSLASSALTILSSVATVLLPHLKSDTVGHIIKIYPKIISSMMLTVYFALLAYFPICILIRIILPEYVQSLQYLRVFLPELGLTCCVTMIIYNYYNALGKSKFYFYMSVFMLIASIIIDGSICLIFHDPFLIACGSLITLFIWYILSEHFLIKWYAIKWKKNLSYIILMALIFFLSSIIHNVIIGAILYLILYLAISMVMFKQFLKRYLLQASRKILYKMKRGK